jgi:uncharacterized DUF497 family protein
LEWDETKSETNRIKRGFGFEIVYEFDWDRASYDRDTRRDYGEERFRAYGWAGELRLCIAFTNRNGDRRIISVRQMHEEEAEFYGINKKA